MKRLYDNELIYGRLLTINGEHLVARYNKALKAFGVKETKLSAFNIDKTGFSPQIAEEIGDYDYLDPNGVNRRFIILTPAQAELPVVHTAFSNTSELMYDFFSRNARAINALTIKDVIYGEIEDSGSEVTSIDDLLSINQVEFKVLSADDVLGKAAELRRLTDRLKVEPDAWRDDSMLNRMVELAKAAGDIRENPLAPDQVVFRHNAYWTSHFGGLYIFVGDKLTTVIGNPDAPGFRKSRPWQVSYLSITDPDAVIRFLAKSGRLELPRASWIVPSKYLEHRAEMVIRALIRQLEPERDLNKVDKIWLQTWMHNYASLIAENGDFPFLSKVKREISDTGTIDIANIAPRRRFFVVRARPDHEDAWLVNRLISEFVPSDFIARYVFNKQTFYKDYESWSEPFREHVVEMLKDTYLTDKARFREEMYGLKPD